MKEFDIVIGYEEIKKELEYVLDIMIHKEKYEKLGVKIPRGLIITGRVGLGKTLMSQCFINASGRKSITIRKDKSDGDFIKHIKEAFEEAKKIQSAIIFLDDMDKFANEDEYHKNAEEFVTIQSCIDGIREEDIFVIATANDINRIPESLLRAGRLGNHIEVEHPNKKNAAKIIEYYLHQKQYVEDIDVDFIARVLVGKSCAELEMIINEAGIYAGFDNRDKISNDDIIKACLKLVFNAPEVIEGRYFQLSDVLGVEKERGYTFFEKRQQVEVDDKHWITENIDMSKIKFNQKIQGVYPLTAKLLSAHFNEEYPLGCPNACNADFAVNEYGNGRSVYLSGISDNNESFRFVYKTLLWLCKKENELKKAYSDNPNVDVFYYEKNNVYAVFNSSHERVETEIYDINGNKHDALIEPLEIKWLKY